MHFGDVDVRSLFNSMDGAPIPIIALDQESCVTSWNAAAERLLGWSRADMLGHPFLLGPCLDNESQDFFGALPIAGSAREIRHRHKNGRTVDLSLWGAALTDAGGKRCGTVALLTEITERKRSESRLAVQNAAIKVLNEHDSSDSLIPAMLEAICRELRWNFGAFWRADEEALERKSLWINPEMRSIACLIDPAGVGPGPALVTMARDRREPAWIEHFDQMVNCGECGANCRNMVRSAMSIPIMLGKRFWGALEFYSEEQREADDATVACLHGIGSQIANSIERGTAQELLRESEKRYRAIFENAGIGISGASLDGKLWRMNPAFLHILGYSKIEELQGRRFQEITHPDDLPRELDLLDAVLRGESNSYVIEKRYLRVDGTTVWARVTVTLVNEDPKLFIAIVENIDDQRRARELLQRSEERFRLMIEGSEQVFFYEHDVEHRITYVSPSVRNVLGYDPQEIAGLRYDDLLTGDSSDRIVTEYTDGALRDSQHRPSYTVTTRHKSGYPVLLEISESPVRNERGEVFMQGFARDVSQRKVTEERLRLSDEILRAVDSLVLVADRTGQIIYANPFTTKTLGYRTEELLGYGWWNLTASGGETPRENCERIAQQARGEIPPYAEPHEQLIHDRDGNPHWILWSDAVGPWNVLIGTGQEITKRKLAEQALEDRTNQLDALVENIPLGIVAVDQQHHIVMCNPEFERLFQYSQAEIAGKELKELIVPESIREESVRCFAETIRGKQSHLTAERFRKDGGVVLVDLYALPLRVNGQIIGAYGIYQDVTERVRAERALRESEEMLELFFSQSLVGAFFTMLDEPILWDDSVNKEEVIEYIRSHLRVTKVNQALADQYRTTPEELLGQTLAEVRQRSEAYDDKLIRRVLEEDRVQIEIEDKTMDGAPLWVTADYITMRDSQGRVIGHFGMQRNITEEKRLESQLRQSQKMEAVGRLAGGVAHDFNNMLTVIRGYSELMLRKLAENHPLRRYATAIMSAADRSAAITQQLLAFSRRQVLQAELMSLNTVVADMGNLLRRLIGEDIELNVLLSADLGQTKADPGQVGQILLNLAVNARDAMPRGGKLTIETENVELDRAYANKHLSIRPGAYVMLSVTDTGCGMDSETCSHIFEPFFTTKEQGKGTGLGLATVYGIVNQSGGAIYVYSELDEGTTFKIYLPRVDAPAKEETTELKRNSSISQTVLLIEDEEATRHMLSEYLFEQGYNVLSAESGQKAVELCEQPDASVDIVLSDVVLAGVSGQDISGYIATRFSRVKMLYMSGFSQNNLVSRRVLSPDAPFLQKPFRMTDLSAKLREMLGTTEDAGEEHMQHRPTGSLQWSAERSQ